MRVRLSVVAAVVTAMSAMLAGCSSGASEAPPADSENAQKPEGFEVSKPEDLKIAYFIASEATSYLAVSAEAAKDAAEEAGATLDIVNSNFDPQAQFNQIKSALTSGKYNAFLVEALDPALVCDVLTKDAPAKGIAVALANQPICDTSQESGDDVWSPGTVNTVVTQSADTYRAWVNQVVEDHPDGVKVAALLGVSDLTPINVSFITALKEAEAENPGFEVVSRTNTDYSAAQGKSAAETLLQANPDLDVIMSGYSPMSQAVADAVDSAGRSDEVEIYDLGGDASALKSVASGEFAATVYLDPDAEARLAIQGLIDIVNGDTTPKYLDLSIDPSLPDGSAIVTSDNVDQFTARY